MAFQNPENLQKLRRVLNVLCLQNPQRVGYVQGMNFLVATFLYGVDLNEEAGFWGLIRLFNRMNLLQLYDVDSGKFRELTF